MKIDVVWEFVVKRGAVPRFLTIDSWQSRSQFERMRRAAREEYGRLDAACEGLTVSERPLGVFRSA